ncbi:MAG TPA: helix-turn-helix domain-containing protein [Pyrinomonadaceae bacterium]|nr:helix-turn-helix domain-containing protein [Pyrinomonadaceae bacterium]
MNPKTPDQNSEELARAGGGESSLGTRLRQAREARGVSLRELSDQTRIARRYLEAIEADDYKELPGGIFNRSFIKAYAKGVGFSEAEAVSAYTEVARAAGEAPDELPTSRQSSRIYMDGDTARSPIITAFLSLVILAIISLGIYAGLHYYQRRNNPDALGAPPPGTGAPNATTANPGTNDQTLPAQGQPAAPSSSDPAATAANGLNVQIRAKGEEVWLRTRVDEETNSDGILAADQVRDYKPSERLSVQFSKAKAKAIEVTINGRPAVVPTDAKGKPLVEMVITKDGYEQLLQQP